MRKVLRVEESEGNEKTFDITLTDGTSSQITLVKDNEEWVLQGEDEQRFSHSELKTISNLIYSLNERLRKFIDEE